MSRTGEKVYLKKVARVCESSPIRYYDDGAKLFDAEKAALKEAKKFIFLEFFIVSSGKDLSEVTKILEEKAKSGVKIYFLYDALGSLFSLKKEDIKKLRAAGVKLQKSIPIRGKWLKYANNRDHRKIVVVDNKIAFTGGINLADEYTHKITRFGYWQDSGLSVRGDAVTELSEVFIRMWNEISAQKIIMRRPKTKTKKAKKTPTVAIIASEPRTREKTRIIKNIYLNSINTAKKSLLLSTPYLVCDEEILNSLKNAARRGVKVTMITPRTPDKKLVCKIGRSKYHSLIEAGVQIFEFLPGIIHGKNLIRDGSSAISGTVNFDYRSFEIDFEVAVWTDDKRYVRSLTHDYNNILKKSERISSGRYPTRSLSVALSRPLHGQF